MQPEHVSTVIPRAMNGHLPQGAPAPSTEPTSLTPRPKNLHDLVTRFDAVEALENPDLVTKLSVLRMEENGRLALPRLGSFAITPWARTQLATAAGLRWARFFENATPKDQADEMNRRLVRATSTARLRTRRFADGEADASQADGTLTAFVSSTYSPIPDSRLARHLIDALRPKNEELQLIRFDMTDKTVSYCVKLGDPYRYGDCDVAVGDVWGSLMVRNSGTGFSSLSLMLELVRLACLNGMTNPVDPIVLKRRHRGIDDAALKQLLAESLENVSGRLHEGNRRLRLSTRRPVEDVPAELVTVLRNAGLPQRLLPALLTAYDREPLPTAFGVSQAITLAAQNLAPEDRLELEEAAGAYLATN